MGDYAGAMSITATGHSYQTPSGTVLDAWYPQLDDPGTTPRRTCLAEELGFIKGVTVETTIESVDAAPTDAADAYLRLQLISRREYQPHQINLDGIFGLLANVAWTSGGPVEPADVDAFKVAAADKGHQVDVRSVDKFPQMLDYVIPSGVRIAIANRVRLGAHLGEGTTVMHEGFVNFNAGTLGAAMVEGRISAGVVVGENSDIGGGASIQGTLSGGGKETISIGSDCLLGANAGIGISLGDNCTVEAGLYVTAGTKVTLPDETVVNARELSGESGLLYRRHSVTGRVEAVSNTDAKWQGLNSSLHKN